MSYKIGIWVEIIVGAFTAFSDLHRKISVSSFCKIVSLKQTSENVCLLKYQRIWLWSTICAATVKLGPRKNSWSWHIRSFAIQTSENTWLHVFKHTIHCRVMMVQYKLPDIGKCLRSPAGCCSNQYLCVLSSVYSFVFYPMLSVGGSAVESLSTVFHLRRMENDVKL